MRGIAVGALVLAHCSEPSERRGGVLLTDPAFDVALSGASPAMPVRRAIALINIGNAPLTVTSLSLARNPTRMSVDGGEGPDACGPAPVTLAPRARCTIGVTFAPVDGGAEMNTLQLASEDTDQPMRPLALIGSGVDGGLRIRPDWVDFGLVAGHAGPVTLRVENGGFAPVTPVIALEPSDAEFSFAADAPAALAPGGGFDVAVSDSPDPSPGAPGQARLVASAGGDAATATLVGPPVALASLDCPLPGSPPGTCPPLLPATLDGSRSRAPGGAIARYAWTLVDHPPASDAAAAFVAGEDFGDCRASSYATAQPCFEPDVPGAYSFQLVVVDDRPTCALHAPGAACAADAECCSFSCASEGACAPGAGDGVCRDGGGCRIASAPAMIRMDARPDTGLYARLSWDGPPGTDLDLHVVRCSGSTARWASADDAYWSDPAPDWGAPRSTESPPRSCTVNSDCAMDAPYTTCVGLASRACTDTSDDPRLNGDFTSPPGNELTSIRSPVPDVYAIGVKHFAGDAPSNAIVHVFVAGREIYTGDATLDPGQLWVAGRVNVAASLFDSTFDEVCVSDTNPASGPTAALPSPCGLPSCRTWTLPAR